VRYENDGLIAGNTGLLQMPQLLEGRHLLQLGYFTLNTVTSRMDGDEEDCHDAKFPLLPNAIYGMKALT
jgi:hypothetical protein